LQLQNRWSISKCKSLIDSEIKIADRFSYENRDPILRSVCTYGPETGFQSLIDFKMKFADRFWSGNRWSIPEWKSISDFSGAVFDRDRDRDCSFKTADRFENWLPGEPQTIMSSPTRWCGSLGRLVGASLGRLPVRDRSDFRFLREMISSGNWSAAGAPRRGRRGASHLHKGLKAFSFKEQNFIYGQWWSSMVDDSSPTGNYSTERDRFYKRLEYLGNLIQVINGAFLTIFIAFFTASLSSNGDIKSLIVCISILFFWRFYIHLVDNEIIDIYNRIVYCEEKMGILEEQISLKGSLMRAQKTNPIFYNRGQFIFDLFALIVMVALLLNSISSINDQFPIPFQWPLTFIAGFEIVIFVVYIWYITNQSVRQMPKKS
jgi:hypothetical protein